MKQKSITVVIFLIVLLGISSWFWYDHLSLIQKLSEANQAKAPNTALISCLNVAATNYNQKWNALCRADGQVDACTAFIGSPKDIQFTQIKDQEQTLCATLYK